jgi:hypothetical protein
LLIRDLLVTQVDFPIEPGKFNIDPVGIFGFIFEKTGVLNYPGIGRIFKGIRDSCHIICLILMTRELDFIITPAADGIIAVTCQENHHNRDRKKGNKPSEGHTAY